MEVNIHEAKTHLSRLLERVAMGEEVIIAKAGTPVAKIVPIKRAGGFKFGSAKGKIVIADVAVEKLYAGTKVELGVSVFRSRSCLF
jgi:prevent-host-death family protein